MTTTQGLSDLDVRIRKLYDQVNDYEPETSRSYIDIIKQNVFNFINVVLFFIGFVMVVIGRYGDAFVSVGLILMNVLIGIYQEIRAKQKLDRIALLNRPCISVIRNGQEQTIDPAQLVLNDVVIVRPGDQIVADGVLVEGSMEVDESMLTGESDAILKHAGHKVLSGSFCVTGTALFEAKSIGTKSFANQLTAEARSFRVVKTPLQHEVDFLIRILMLIALFIGVLLLISAITYDVPLMRSVQMAAVIAGLVPSGLFFMVIVAYAMGAVRVATRGALIQQANSVESLSNVNVLCMDKTGTLTANRIEFRNVCPVGIEKVSMERILGDFAASISSPNRTIEALREALDGHPRSVADEVPFSSSRKWSALAFEEVDIRGTYVLGALEMLQSYMPPLEADERQQITDWENEGLRVVFFAYQPEDLCLHDADGLPLLPETLIPLGAVCFSDVLRERVAETLHQFNDAGIRLKIISGDNPHTVAALAKQAGLTGELSVISGPELARLDDVHFEQVAEEATVFGRIAPHQKEKLVEVLRGKGYYVAMVGDGVNDVLSLKKANLGIAMQSGSNATRGVADMVLLDDSFASLPPAFLEGQRIVNGMQDILRLFLTRVFYTVLLILATQMIGIAFPFVPKHISLLTLLTVGIPTFALAVWARPAPKKRGLLRSVTHFVAPATILTFIFGLVVFAAAFALVYNDQRSTSVSQGEIEEFRHYSGIDYEIQDRDDYAYEVASLYARTALTTFTTLAGLLLFVFVEPPAPAFVGGDKLSDDIRPTLLAITLLITFILVNIFEPARHFFELITLDAMDYVFITLLVMVWGFLLRYAWRHDVYERFLGIEVVK